MNPPKNTNKIQYFLLLLQTIILFSQGVFGSKIAELITVSPLLILVLSILSILLILPISIFLSQQNLELPSFRGIIKSILSRISTSFPFFAVLGALGAILFFYVSKDHSQMCVIPLVINPPFDCIGAWKYEVWNFVLLCLLIIATTLSKENLLIILSCAIGFSTGASGAMILLASNENEYFLTLGGWMLFSTIAALIIYALHIPKLISILTSER